MGAMENADIILVRKPKSKGYFLNIGRDERRILK
jgi:hypothetical protein